MRLLLLTLFSIIYINVCFCTKQTLYEYYTSGGIKSGLKADSIDLSLNDKQIVLLSGSLHYFRLHHKQWEDRLLKYKSAGLNTVQTYIAWNVHEEHPGEFDFETGFRNLSLFINLVKEADLLLIVRIGPFICAEWELGGYPPWLLRDPNMKFRSNYGPHMKALETYYQKVLSIVNDYQFKKGGPIIAMQFENEFAGIKNSDDLEYFMFMKDTIDKSGFNELLFNCDPLEYAAKVVKNNQTLPGILEVDNFNSDSLKFLSELRAAQPNRPLFVSEFWPGLFDVWGQGGHAGMGVEVFSKEVTDILFVGNASINFYMFFGGTNFGFMNGGAADGQHYVVTSYDYNAPLSESGNYSEKYWKAKELFAKLTQERHLPDIHIPEPPEVEPSVGYGVVKIQDYLSLDDVLSQIQPFLSDKPTQMESLNLGSNYGQNYGFIHYRVFTKEFKHLILTGGVYDRALILIDGKQVAIVESHSDYLFNTSGKEFSNTTTDHMLDIIVENMGRMNVGQDMNKARKGLNGSVVLDETVVSNFTIFPLEFKEDFVLKLKSLKGRQLESDIKSPALFRAELTITDSEPSDTFIRLDNWVKGVVFINGFNIGRYYNVGPQHTLYIPGPHLKTGSNDVYVFELHTHFNAIEFVDKPDLG